MALWQEKAHSIIAELCYASYKHQNPTPKRKHKPYSVPLIAQWLVECLGHNDEVRAKSIFMSLHDTPELKREL